jgi:hypothetical protein
MVLVVMIGLVAVTLGQNTKRIVVQMVGSPTGSSQAPQIVIKGESNSNDAPSNPPAETQNGSDAATGEKSASNSPDQSPAK